jgi:hypothetical protein
MLLHRATWRRRIAVSRVPLRTSNLNVKARQKQPRFCHAGAAAGEANLQKT